MANILLYKIVIVVWSIVLTPCWTGNEDSLIDGLVAYLPFDEGEGNIAYDLAFNNHATITGAQWNSALQDFVWVTSSK